MTKRFCAIFLTVLLATSLFGFSSKSVGLTSSDIKAFIDNFDELDSIMEESLDFETNVDIENFTLAEIMALIPAENNKKACKELNKLGISGSNALEKVFAISYGVSYNYIKSMLDLLKLFAEEGDDSLEEMDSYIASYENSISETDLKVIDEYNDELFSLLGWDSDGGSSDIDWSDYDYDWDDDDYDYDWDDYDWGDYDDYDWSDYDWDDEEYFTEEEELDSETGVAFLKALIPSLNSKSGSANFLYKTIKPGTYTKIKETDENAFMFQKEWDGSKYPELSVSEFCISIGYKDPTDPEASWNDMVYKYYYLDGTTELYKATIRGTDYYERVLKTKQYGTIRIWVDGTNLGSGEDAYYSNDIYAVLSIGDYIIEGVAFVPAG